MVNEAATREKSLALKGSAEMKAAQVKWKMGEGRTRAGAPSRPREGGAAPSGSPSSARFIPVFF